MTFRERKDRIVPLPPEQIERVYVEVGARMRWLRQQKNWSREELGARLGVHAATATNWELAKARVKLSELVRVAAVFGVSLEVFLADLRVEDAAPAAAMLESRAKQARNRAKTMAAKTAAKTKPKKKK